MTAHGLGQAAFRVELAASESLVIPWNAHI